VSETKIIFVADCVRLSTFLRRLRKHMHFETESVQSSKVVDFRTSRKCTCNFLLVVNSNIGPISSRFRDVAGFLFRKWPRPYSTKM